MGGGSIPPLLHRDSRRLSEKSVGLGSAGRRFRRHANDRDGREEVKNGETKMLEGKRILYYGQFMHSYVKLRLFQLFLRLYLPIKP